MLKIVQIENRIELEKCFDQFDALKDVWMVSDLRSKFSLQKKLLTKRGFFLDSSVLRASDFWKLLVKRNFPQLKVISSYFAKTLVKRKLDIHGAEWGIRKDSLETVMKYMNLLAPILLHSEGPQKMAEWFSQHPESAARWKQWYLISRLLMVEFVENKKIITNAWLSSYLQNNDHFEKCWNQNMIVDLGGQFSLVESELIQKISRIVDVTIVENVLSDNSKYSYLLKPYDYLKSYADEIASATSASTINKMQVYRFSSPLAEIKHAVFQIRKWIDMGALPSKIAVIAPQAENYWPILHSYLKEEGVGANKDVTVKIQSMPVISRWISHLRILSGKLSTGDLEVSLYSHAEESQKIRYEEFKSLFQNIYDVSDFGRHGTVRQLYEKQINHKEEMNRDEFIAKIMSHWFSETPELLIVIVREIIENANNDTQLYFDDWLNYVEMIIATKECVIEKGDINGIQILKIESAISSDAAYRIFLGLSEESMKEKNKLQLLSEDYHSLSQDLGFFLSSPDKNDLEYELNLLKQTKATEDQYLFSATDFSGAVQTPSGFWLKLKNNLGKDDSIDIPELTRWDERQISDNFRKITDVEKRIHIDSGVELLEPMEWKNLPSLSATSLEKFLACPFKLASEKYFKLKDLPIIDLDVDAATRGSLAHALFEKIVADPIHQFLSEDQIGQILEEIKIEKKLQLADARLWPSLKSRYILIAQKFINFEAQWKAEFLKTKTIAKEKKFEFYFTSLGKEIKISGQIDRIDTDGEVFVVIDYKSSSYNTHTYKSWINNHELQMLLYIWVIENAIIPNASGKVVGAFYYYFKTMKRTTGMRVKEYDGRLFGSNGGSGASEVEKGQLLKDFFDLLNNTVERIIQGQMAPHPEDKKICKKCEWSDLCRAPHLM